MEKIPAPCDSPDVNGQNLVRTDFNATDISSLEPVFLFSQTFVFAPQRGLSVTGSTTQASSDQTLVTMNTQHFKFWQVALQTRRSPCAATGWIVSLMPLSDTEQISHK